MKKIIVFILAIAIIVPAINAQHHGDDLRDRFLFGLKAGANYSNVYDAVGEQFNADPKFGFVGGAFIVMPFNRFIAFQPEFLFSQKGFKATGVILGSPYKFTRSTNFIDVPLLISLRPSSYLSFLVGPQYSYLIKQKDEFITPYTSDEQIYEFDNDNIRKNILCLLVGFDLNLSNIIFGARAGWDLQTNHGDGTSSTPRYKNVWYQATLGIRF
jgi:hypothetical protein